MFKFFGKHYGTERFFVIIFTCFCVMIGTIGYSIHLSNKINSVQLGSTVIYTQNTIWSRTKNAIDVVSIHSNTDRTKVFMLMKNSEGLNDTFLQSVNAKDYQMFVTTAENGPYTKTPKATVFSYGTTGYFGIYLVDMSGFTNEILSIILRSNTAASQMVSEDELWEGTENDVSFRENNQVRIYVNLGGKDMPILTALDNDIVDPVLVYNQINYADAFENNTLITWNNKLEDMRKCLMNIAQYRQELDKLGVIVPDLPYYIANDYIDTTPIDITKEPIMFTENMLDDIYTGFDDMPDDAMVGLDTNIETETSENTTIAQKTYKVTTEAGVIEKPYLYLHTNYIYPGGLNFEWQGTTYVQGLVSKLPDYFKTDDNIATTVNNYLEWREELMAMYPDEPVDGAMPSSVSYSAWRKADGSYIDMDDSDNYMAPSIDKYVQAVNTYMSLKYEYQVMLFNEELKSQADVKKLESMMTKNSENVIYIY